MLSGCVAPVAIAGDNVGRSNCENSQQANVFRISSTAVIQRDEAMAVLLRRQPDTFSGTLDNEALREWVLTISERKRGNRSQPKARLSRAWLEAE
jgi:hypothetical protein